MVEPPTDRLTEDELRQLRARLGGPDDHSSEAASVGDVAEAAGVDPNEVRRHLDAIRAEQAFRKVPEKPRSQAPLLILALVMFGVAYGIWKARQPPDLDAQLKQALARRDAVVRRLARENLSPDVKVPEGTPLPPPGFKIEMHGTYKRLTAAGKGGPIPRAETAKKALADSYVVLLGLLMDAEKNRSPKAKPLQMSPMDQANPREDIVYVSVANSYFESSLLPRPGEGSAEYRRRLREEAIRSIEGVVDSTIASQNNAVRGPEGVPSPNHVISPPFGFGVQFTGSQQTTYTSQRILVAPILKGDVAAGLQRTVRSMIFADRNGSLAPYMNQNPDKKPAPPKFYAIKVTGPMRDIMFQMPTGDAPGYASAADAVKAADRILVQQTRLAEKQIDELNATAR